MDTILTVFDRYPVIEGERITLRRITKQDAPDMFAYCHDPEVSRHLLWSPHPSMEYTCRYIDAVLKQYKAHSFFDFAVVCKEDGRMIGTCGFTRVDMPNKTVELGYVLAAPYWHRGIATEAVSLILRFAFHTLGFHRAEARYMVENDRSRAVMENNGMQFEGVARHAVCVKGSYRDIGRCAILKDEFFSRFGSLPLSLTYEPPRRPFFFTS